MADKSFLNLWSYPNVYRDTIVNGQRTGKEICDLLVVCGDHVLVFSDKTIEWPASDDINLSWARWYRRAIAKSVDQIRGAERWIRQNPDRLFLDKACTQRLPLQLPSSERRRLVGIVVAMGAAEACQAHFGDGSSGSFIVRPGLRDENHLSVDVVGYSPFSIGDVDSRGSFIHVLNDVTLDIVMSELDTISDFANYLDKKAAFVRSGNLMSAAGEEELLAYYLTHSDGEDHAFAHPEGRPWVVFDRVSVDRGAYAKLRGHNRYRIKKDADQISYMWDRLIEAFTVNILAGTTIVPSGRPFVLADHEVTVRHMAHETRVSRRVLSGAMRGLLEVAHRQDRTFRAVVPPPENPRNGTGYVFMTLAVPKLKLEGGYQQYREVRINMLYAYCMVIMSRARYLQRVIGVAMEPPGHHVSSEDLILLYPPKEWSSEFESEVRDLSRKFDTLRDKNTPARYFGGDEYPESVSAEAEQFSFMAASKMANIPGKIGRNERCPCGSGKKFKNCCLGRI